MAWMKGCAALAGLLLFTACGATSRDDPSPNENEETTSEVDTELCRVQGFGIGFSDLAQCDPTHLLAHSADACSSSGGTTEQPQTNGSCEPALEFQVTCCYPDALPSVESVAPPRIGGTFTLLLADEEKSSRDLLLAAADDACAVEEPQARLGDWLVYYAPDGVTPLGLRYVCFAARP